ncbi:MAG: MotA/TolQ/ExbB proton channel family protein [Myxococcales bacterium FL481]|nr:MAG: MotA/TolQ/ExbB proton channel family protein [Myxococcales bacterium FL481]
MYEWLQSAGPFVWPIVLASVVGVGVFLERLSVLVRLGRKDDEVLAHVLQLCRDGKSDEARHTSQAQRSPVGVVLATTLAALDLPPAERDPMIRAAGNRELRSLERGLRVIAVIARLAPLMGLLGTVVGLVDAFRAVAASEGPADPTLLAGGIWQALLTTVAGLLVAIPAVVSHEWLLSRSDAMAGRMQTAVAELLAVAVRHAKRNDHRDPHDRV